MPRAIWKGAISFGLVTIPVELHTAVRDGRPRFHLLHARDRAPIKYQRVCQREGKEVPWDDVVKGYEYTKGRFVVLTREDFQAAAVEKSRTIDIIDFVKSEEIDDRYFETSYYLVPPKGGERAYALLRAALRETDRVGIAKIILRDSQHVAAVTVHDAALVLTMMRFSDEIVKLSDFELPGEKEVRPKELQLARTLVDNLADTWSPEKYVDEYRSNLMRIIDAKIKGEEVEFETTASEAPPAVVDLMERLRQSLGQAPAGRRAKAGSRERLAEAAERPKRMARAHATRKKPTSRKRRAA